MPHNTSSRNYGPHSIPQSDENALSLLVDYTLQGRGIDTDSLQYTEVRGSLPLAATCALVSAMAIVFLWRTHRVSEI